MQMENTIGARTRSSDAALLIEVYIYIQKKQAFFPIWFVRKWTRSERQLFRLKFLYVSCVCRISLTARVVCGRFTFRVNPLAQ